jgi:hypothetical protein
LGVLARSLLGGPGLAVGTGPLELIRVAFLNRLIPSTFLKREVGICMDNDLGIAYIAIE